MSSNKYKKYDRHGFGIVLKTKANILSDVLELISGIAGGAGVGYYRVFIEIPSMEYPLVVNVTKGLLLKAGEKVKVYYNSKNIKKCAFDEEWYSLNWNKVKSSSD